MNEAHAVFIPPRCDIRSAKWRSGAGFAQFRQFWRFRLVFKAIFEAVRVLPITPESPTLLIERSFASVTKCASRILRRLKKQQNQCNGPILPIYKNCLCFSFAFFAPSPNGRIKHLIMRSLRDIFWINTWLTLEYILY